MASPCSLLGMFLCIAVGLILLWQINEISVFVYYIDVYVRHKLAGDVQFTAQKILLSLSRFLQMCCAQYN
jgi:hypothetical protein